MNPSFKEYIFKPTWNNKIRIFIFKLFGKKVVGYDVGNETEESVKITRHQLFGKYYITSIKRLETKVKLFGLPVVVDKDVPGGDIRFSNGSKIKGINTSYNKAYTKKSRRKHK